MIEYFEDKFRTELDTEYDTEYEHKVKGCVNGQNIVKYEDKSLDECKDICSEMDECMAFEYGVDYGGAGNYKARDC